MNQITSGTTPASPPHSVAQATEPHPQQPANPMPGVQNQARAGTLVAAQQHPAAGDYPAQLTSAPAWQDASSAGSEVQHESPDGEVVHDLAWYKEQAERGNPAAQMELGLMYEEGEALSLMYEEGEGVPQDLEQAAALYSKAARQGNAEAQHALGYMYFSGSGVMKDLEKAFAFFRQAAGQGCIESQNALALMYRDGLGVEKDAGAMCHWLERAAEQGDLEAQLDLGLAYFHGWEVERNVDKAFPWLEKAAKQGSDMAQFRLGEIYTNGLGGVAPDPALAFHWTSKAAQQGNAPAQYHLGYLYFRGIGVTQDQGHALQLFGAAARQGDEFALGSLAIMYIAMLCR